MEEQTEQKTHANMLARPLPYASQDGQETASRGTERHTHKHASSLMSTRTVQGHAPPVGGIEELQFGLQIVTGRENISELIVV